MQDKVFMFLFFQVCPRSSCLLTNVHQTLNSENPKQLLMAGAFIPYFASNAVKYLDLCYFCVVSPSVCSPSSSPVLGCSPAEGCLVLVARGVLLSPTAMSGFNLLHLITKSQPVALRSCSLPSGPLTGCCVPAVLYLS